MSASPAALSSFCQRRTWSRLRAPSLACLDHCPADLPEALAGRIRELGLRAAQVLGCTGVSRVDFRLPPKGEPSCLEVNTIPGMTPTSLVPMAAWAVGLSYEDVVARTLELAAVTGPHS